MTLAAPIWKLNKKMANYFSKFPKLYHSFDGFNTSQYITNLLTRFTFEQNFKTNTAAYYEYDIREGDTPEIVASKIYNSPERHWIVLLMNDMVDPQFDWPLQYETLTRFIDSKYLSNAGSNTTGQGLVWSKSNTHGYYRVEKQRLPDGSISLQRYRVDANTYANTLISLNNSTTLSDNTVVVFDTTKETQTYYDYELLTNERKRRIKLLKPELVESLELELGKLL
jgi:hypothetical protein